MTDKSRRITMIRFQCDTCGRLKENGEAWILGFAAENLGISSARREVSISGTWDRAGAVDTLAVHFCSDECRAEYMDALFGETPTTREGEATVTKRRVKRIIPGAVVETVVTEKPRPAVVKRTVVRRKRAA